MNTGDELEVRIQNFKQRMGTQAAYCEELFRYATIRLLAFKYAYYVHSHNIVGDDTYDIEERSWWIMGKALGHVTDETVCGPCVDWDAKHPLADEGRKMALKLGGKALKRRLA